jgi:hypothetical protein
MSPGENPSDSPAATGSEAAGDSAVLVATAIEEQTAASQIKVTKRRADKIKSPEVVLNLFASASSSL